MNRTFTWQKEWNRLNCGMGLRWDMPSLVRTGNCQEWIWGFFSSKFLQWTHFTSLESSNQTSLFLVDLISIVYAHPNTFIWSPPPFNFCLLKNVRWFCMLFFLNNSSQLHSRRSRKQQPKSMILNTGGTIRQKQQLYLPHTMVYLNVLCSCNDHYSAWDKR